MKSLLLYIMVTRYRVPNLVLFSCSPAAHRRSIDRLSTPPPVETALQECTPPRQVRERQEASPLPPPPPMNSPTLPRATVTGPVLPQSPGTAMPGLAPLLERRENETGDTLDDKRKGLMDLYIHMMKLHIQAYEIYIKHYSK